MYASFLFIEYSLFFMLTITTVTGSHVIITYSYILFEQGYWTKQGYLKTHFEWAFFFFFTPLSQLLKLE